MAERLLFAAVAAPDSSWKTRLGVVAALGVAGLLLAVAVVGCGSSSKTTSTSTTTKGTTGKKAVVVRTLPPPSLLREIAQRGFWLSIPRTFPSASTGRVPRGSAGFGVASVRHGDVIAVTPSGLVDHPNLYDGQLVYLVGRVQSVVPIDPQYGATQLTRLVPDNGKVVYIFSAGALALKGEVIFALGRIAATGPTIPGGKYADTAAFVTLNDNAEQELDYGPIELLQRNGGSAAILAAAERLAKNPH